MLGGTREEIAREKLAVVGEGATVVLCEPEWRPLVGRSVLTGRSNLALAVAAAETFLGGTVDPAAAEGLSLPGRFERVSEEPLEIHDGAHTPDGIGWLLPRLPDRRYVVVASILRDKDADAMLAALAAVGDTLVATESSNERALSADELATLGGRWFPRTERVQDPREALGRARAIAGAGGAVSGDGVAVPPRRPRRAPRRRTIHNGPRLGVYVFAAIVIVAFAGIAFAVGYVVGKMLL